MPLRRPIQGSAKRWSPGLVNFVTALAYHFCLALPAAFTQPGARLFADLCMNSDSSPAAAVPVSSHLLQVTEEWKWRHDSALLEKSEQKDRAAIPIEHLTFPVVPRDLPSFIIQTQLSCFSSGWLVGSSRLSRGIIPSNAAQFPRNINMLKK